MDDCNIGGQQRGARISVRWKRWLVLPFLALGLWVAVDRFDGFSGRSSNRDQELIRKVVGSEELILELTPILDQLSRGLMDLQLPSIEESAAVFGEMVTVVDLAGAAKEVQPDEVEVLVEPMRFPIFSETSQVPSDELELWRSLLDEVSYFEHASFRFVMGEFPGASFDTFRSEVMFKGLARSKDGMWLGVSGRVSLGWRRDSSGWRIDIWETRKLEASTGKRRLFAEVLDEALPDQGDRFRARHSIHEDHTVRYYQEMKKRALSHDFAPIAILQKPAVTVGDVDGDGFDDLYVMVRTGKNLLLRNRGDGTFEERGEQFELAVNGDSTCGLFADFDNDGDQDLMLGRALKRCVYYENVDGWFSEVTQPVALPSLAVSMSAADYNGDGLLDLYISTYRPGSIGVGLGIESGDTGERWPERFLSPQEAVEFYRRFEHSRSGAVPHKGFLDQAGPPNRLLMNVGGGQFKPAPQSDALALWKNTLQASWSDYDGDGDPDLYVANDWAGDRLFRNDEGVGFTDVTPDVGTDLFGFAMGASWGDYNNDGLQDLYVSNMYSKAGRRIMSQIGGLDSQLQISAEGNFLYRQEADGTFKHVSGLEDPALLVADAGWSWGGQFADFDNDADLDLYALSGYFTAPPEVASEVDL